MKHFIISLNRVHLRNYHLLQETSRRFLHFTVPRVVAVSPQMRLIEDNPASVSLLDIYKQGCTRVGLEHDSPVLRYYERLAAVQVQFVADSKSFKIFLDNRNDQ
jgi:transformation/transcription domain-associated protein